MKVIIATPYFTPKIGGLELYAERMAHGLAEAGWEVHIITSGDEVARTQHGNITVHTLKTWLQVANTPVNLMWTVQARRIIKALKPDLINVHAPVPSMALAVAAAAGKTPLVVTYHAGSMRKGSLLPDSIIFAYERFMLPIMLHRADHIICASGYVRKEFLTTWNNKSTTITPGVDSDIFTPAPNLRIPSRIIFIGDFRDPRKGLSYLIDAVQQVPGANLRVIGPGSGIPSGSVSYTGILSASEIAQELRAAQMLVLPSTTDAESFGMVLLEAMATGIPVVGTRIGGIPYVIADNVDGILVKPSDVQDLATAISQLLSNPTLAAALGNNGRAKAVQNFGWNERVKQTDQIFTSVVKKASHV